jgi:hypothetical protein
MQHIMGLIGSIVHILLWRFANGLCSIDANVCEDSYPADWNAQRDLWGP